MTSARGRTFGLIGGLAAFPRRLAAREVDAQGGELQRGASRRTTHVIFGRKLLDRTDAARIAGRYRDEIAKGRQPLSENGFLRLLGLIEAPGGSTLSRQSVLDQSGLPARDFDLLALFDAFEHDAEPFSFRDLILARKYAGLIASGASWGTIARSVRRSGSIASLTALSLHADRDNAIYARLHDGVSELDGQALLPLGGNEAEDLDELFALAEEAEDDGRHSDAADLYRRCIAIDPSDPVVFFNRGNCLLAAGRAKEAEQSYFEVLKRDPRFVEAWFNLSGLLAGDGKKDTARRHLLAAIAIDGAYADAVFNLANLDYEAGDLAGARKWWSRYLELDSTSQWARTASNGIRLVDLAERTAS
ncbi:O-linked GlcNAc transferase [Mesorhizobium loti]|nr:tetratricopeptide repeat protein [Mesorhizobium loti]PLP58911.1 O-linked GlcNAc transferase [Mesorhizobium loti]